MDTAVEKHTDTNSQITETTSSWWKRNKPNKSVNVIHAQYIHTYIHISRGLRQREKSEECLGSKRKMLFEIEWSGSSHCEDDQKEEKCELCGDWKKCPRRQGRFKDSGLEVDLALNRRDECGWSEGIMVRKVFGDLRNQTMQSLKDFGFNFQRWKPLRLLNRGVIWIIFYKNYSDYSFKK